MNLFIESHQLWLKKLLAAQVNFIIVGGYSVIFHGYKRTTGDIDVWLQPTNQNKEKLKIIADIDDLKIPFIHLNHLVLSKFNTGRLKDKADIEMLQKIDRSQDPGLL